MKLKEKASYKSNTSDLIVKVIKIFRITKDYTKAKIEIYHNNGYFYEKDTFILFHKNITHWIKID